jgi:hypothetical protein
VITVNVAIDAAITGHFLLKNFGLTCRVASSTGEHALPVQHIGNGFTIAISDRLAGWLDLRLDVRFLLDGKVWVLDKVRQILVVPPSTQPTLTPVRWYKEASLTKDGKPINIPPLHPHLTIKGTTLTFAPRFLDITDLFMDIHGKTPWFRTLEIVKTTDFSLRVLAFLRGRPLIWYIVAPKSAQDVTRVAPHVSFWAADYGGIDYPHNTEQGITTHNHSISVDAPNQIEQCGGNTLCSYLLSPLTHQEYLQKVAAWTAAQALFEDARRSPKDDLPPELHWMLTTLGFKANANDIWPKNWSLPFGFERTIAGTNRVLVFPQVHKGDAGWAASPGLRGLIDAALTTVASQVDMFSGTTVAAEPLILSGYSESGGNLFRAAEANRDDLRAIIGIEPQYMNEYLKGENTDHPLGRGVIPRLLQKRVKVVIIARRAEAWQRNKYLPRNVPISALTLLPSDQHLGVVAYPPDPAHPFQKHRLSRLLDPANHATRVFILGDGRKVLPPRVPGLEMLVDGRIDELRRKEQTDAKAIDKVFLDVLNNDSGGGSYTHNFMISGGEDPAPFESNGQLKPGRRPKTFVQQALDLIR